MMKTTLGSFMRHQYTQKMVIRMFSQQMIAS
jgi:hypothetical protein